MRFRLAQGPGSQRRAVSQGLAEIDQREFALDLTPGVSDEAAMQVLRYITDYVVTSGQKILPGETMRYGWSTLRFSAEGAYLVVEELARPYAADADAFARGAGQALAILSAQDTAVQRFGLPAGAHHPHRSELAVICRRVSPVAPRHLLVLDRLHAATPDDSGWFIGCGQQDHQHDDVNELARLHLVYVSDLDPRIVTYLAMPVDTRVVLESDRIIVFPPGQQTGRVDHDPFSIGSPRRLVQ